MENVGEPGTAEVLRRFTCTNDPDLEIFLHRNAVMMDKKALSRTYAHSPMMTVSSGISPSG